MYNISTMARLMGARARRRVPLCLILVTLGFVRSEIIKALGNKTCV